MATKPKAISAVEIEDFEFNDNVPQVYAEALEEEEPDVFARIRAYCATSESSGKLGLYRAVENSRKENFIANIDGADFEPELIRDRFGGGEFIIKGYDTRSKIRLNQRLSIEGDPIINTLRASLPVAGQSQAHPAPVDMTAIMQMMQESNRQMLAGLAQIMGNNQAPAPTSRMDMLSEMAAMKDLFGGNAQPASNPMDMLVKGMELAASMTPRQGGDTSGMDVLLESIKSFAPAIGAVVAQANAPKRAARPAQQPPMLANPAISPPNTTTPEDEEAMLLKYYLNLLVGYAAEGRDPVLYADLIADQLPESKLDELLAKPDMVGYLITIVPAVAGQRAWFDAVAAELKTMFSLTVPDIEPNVTGIDTPAQDNNDGNDKHAA